MPYNFVHAWQHTTAQMRHAFHGSYDCMVIVMRITESLSTFLIGGIHGSDMQRDELANQELGRSYFDASFNGIPFSRGPTIGLQICGSRTEAEVVDTIRVQEPILTRSWLLILSAELAVL